MSDWVILDEDGNDMGFKQIQPSELPNDIALALTEHFMVERAKELLTWRFQFCHWLSLRTGLQFQWVDKIRRELGEIARGIKGIDEVIEVKDGVVSRRNKKSPE